PRSPAPTLFPYTTLFRSRKKLDEALSLNPSQAQLKSLLSKIESGAYAQGASRRADEALREGDRALQAGEWAGARHAYDEALGLRSEEHTSELQSRFDLVC